jgi:hypothetical protein
MRNKRLLRPLKAYRRRLRSHSWRLLRASQATREARRARRYYSLARGNARPAPPPVAAFGEIETAFRAGIRSIRLWRWVRRHGGFPEPARVTPQGPIWTERQIAVWLGEAHLDQLDEGVAPTSVNDDDDEDEAALLREIEQRRAAPAGMREVA